MYLEGLHAELDEPGAKSAHHGTAAEAPLLLEAPPSTRSTRSTTNSNQPRCQ